MPLQSSSPPGEITHSGLLERISSGVSLSGQSLDPRYHAFLQSRLGRRETVSREDELEAARKGQPIAGGKGSSLGSQTVLRDENGNEVYAERERADLFDTHIQQGLRDFWHRFQLPFATNSETIHLDEQVVKGVVDELMAFNGWAAAACSSLTRPFAADRKADTYTDLTNNGQLYYFALVVHSADHFLIDQVAAIVQLSKRLGPSNIFVSLLDYASTDSTPFLSDMTEMVFTLLGISFRIKRIPPMTRDPAAAYYPLEEAYTRNLAMEPLLELYHRRKVRFAKVIWLKGFTCPNDILETLRISQVNNAAMTCSMDWKEHNGFFIYNDRWRTRDMDGNLFRGSKSTSPIDEAPPRDSASIKRYAQHLPFQVFCCESGTHIIDPAQSFYAGITYRSSIEHGIFNISAAEDGKAPKWSEGPCMDSAQMHFCRDIWMLSAREGVKSDAKKARDRERKGISRGLSDEMEKIIRMVAPQYAPQDKTSGGLLGFGRKKVAQIVPAVVDEEAEDEDWVEGEADPVAAAQTETPQQAEEKKEQAMAADAAAAALPVEEQHPNEGLDNKEKKDAGANAAADAKAKIAAGAEPAADAKKGKPEDEFVDPEALLELEAQKAAAGGDAAAVADQAKRAPEAKAAPGDGKKQPKVKRAGAANLKERAEAPAAANPAAQVDPKAGKAKVGTANNPDELDALDESAPGAPDINPLTGSSRNKALKNGAFEPARILVNPRCVTTYAGVSHTQLALDLFGDDDDNEESIATGRLGPGGDNDLDDDDDLAGDGQGSAGSGKLGKAGGGRGRQSYNDKYQMRDFGPAAETFVCQEMRTSGGRSAPKQQRRTGFSIARGLMEGWQPR